MEARANTETWGKYRELNHQEELESQGKAEQLSTENYPGDEGEGRGDGGKISLGQRKMAAIFQNYCLFFYSYYFSF